MGSDWRADIALLLILLFTLGVLQSLRTYWRTRRTLREEIEGARPSLDAIQALARKLDRAPPFILILVPARDESAVIHNTLGRLAKLDYPPDRYAVMVITDARERKEKAEGTTYDVANGIAQLWRNDRGKSPVHVIEVPESYSGRFGDPTPTFARSTKGRALNYALEYVRSHPQLSKAEMLGVLDADGRMHPEVLREVAYRVMAHGERLMQGPVFQISNLSDVGLVGKAAGIELSVYHLSTLSYQLLSGRDTARFLAGTNYFVDPRLMIEVGAWNDAALVEDAELGLRLYMQKRVKPAWLSCHEVEQTPPDVRSYLRQRRRWALGHFQLLPIVRNSGLPWYAKAELYGKLLHSVFMSPLDVGLPILGWTAFACSWGNGLPSPFRWLMLALLASSFFVWDYFGRGLRMLDRYAPERTGAYQRWLISVQFFLAMPWLMVLQAAPRLAAMYQYLSGRYNGDWEKTPRTVEEHAPLSEIRLDVRVAQPHAAKDAKAGQKSRERTHV